MLNNIIIGKGEKMSSFFEMINKNVEIKTKYNVEIIDKETYRDSVTEEIEEGDIFILVIYLGIDGQKTLYFDTYEEARRAQLKLEIAHSESQVLALMQKRNVDPNTDKIMLIATLILTVALPVATALFMYYTFGGK